jgi:DNA-binding NtrC family response regulator
MNPRLMNLSWENDAMRRLDEEMRCASQTDASVMLTGESGVGKRFAANMIHELSHRRRGPFVAINAAAIWDYGPYTEGDTTDPLTEGLLQAKNGTLFIQDIEKISASAQLQLFRYMDWAMAPERRVRFMTATGTDLFRLVKAGKFREDLYYRLNVFCFVIPPLRERPEDIPLIFEHYLSLHARTDVPPLSSAARRRLVEYSWPGNIRELTTVTRKLSAERLPDLIEPEHLPCPIGE